MRGASKAVSFSRGTKDGGDASDPGWQMAEAARLRMQLQQAVEHQDMASAIAADQELKQFMIENGMEDEPPPKTYSEQHRGTRTATPGPAAAAAAGKRGDFGPLVALVRGGSEDVTEQAAAALWVFAADDDDNPVTIAAAGAIEPLVALVRVGSEKGRLNAAGALWNLAANADNKVTIVAAGAIEPMVALARGGSEEAKEQAAGALMSLALNDDNQVTIAAGGAIEPLVSLVRSGGEGCKELAAGALEILATNTDNRTKIAATGAIEPLVALVRGGGQKTKEQAAATLLILARNADNQVKIAAAGAIEPLVALARGGTERAKKEAAAALASLALVNVDNQVKIAFAGGLWPMMMHSPIWFLYLVSGHLLTIYLYAAAAKALYGAALTYDSGNIYTITEMGWEMEPRPKGTPTTLGFSTWATGITLFVEVLVMLIALINVGLLGYVRHTAWRAVPPAICIAGASDGPTAMAATTAVALVVLVISAARVPTHVRDLLREEPRAKPKAKGR